MVSSDDVATHKIESASENGKATSTTPDSDSNELSTRLIVGNSINRVTELINDNIIVARYGTITFVTLLTAYGISKTPLFFRYKRVADIPSSLFSNRRSLYGKLVRVVAKDIDILNTNPPKEVPIVCLVQHLSPMGRFLSHFLNKSADGEVFSDLLKVEIAGVKVPPFFYAPPGIEGPNEWLKSLAANHQTVKCTLLSRKIVKPFVGQKMNTSADGENEKILSTERQNNSVWVGGMNRRSIGDLGNPDDEQVAICQLQYRPGMDFFRKDLASSLLSFGRANVASGLHTDDPSMVTIDSSKNLRDIEADVRYLEKLGKHEFESLKASKGMWAIKSIRDSKPDLIAEAEFDINAKWYNKLWRRIRNE